VRVVLLAAALDESLDFELLDAAAGVFAALTTSPKRPQKARIYECPLLARLGPSVMSARAERLFRRVKQSR
jgi:hypothetical protein